MRRRCFGDQGVSDSFSKELAVELVKDLIEARRRLEETFDKENA